MTRSILTKTLREYRVPILGWGIGLAVLIYSQIAAVALLSLKARQDAAQLAAGMRFFGDPIALTTPTGYATWKTMGVLPAILGIWAVLAGARMLRREEERRSLDILLSTPRSRARVLGEKLVALIVALAAIGVLIGLGALGGESRAGVPVDAGGALMAGLDASLAALVFAMLALLVAQVARSAGAAAGLAGTVMVAAYLMEGTGRVAGAGWLQRLSPFYYYDLSKPLIPSAGADWAGVSALAILAVVLGGGAVPLFLRRDIGGVAWTPGGIVPRARRIAVDPPYADRALRAVWSRTLAAQAPAALWWIVGLSIYAAWTVGVARSTEDSLRKILADAPPQVSQILGSHNVLVDAGFLAAILFLYLPLLLVLYALTAATAWARDLDTGSLELVLATPATRARIVAERFGALTLLLVCAPVVIELVVLLSGRLAGLHLDAGYVTAAMLGIFPLELLTASVVFLLAGRASAALDAGLVGALVGLSFFASLLYTVFNLPTWLADLSMFYQYGSPITDGPHWGASLGMAGLALGVLVVGAARFSRADVQRAR